MKNEGNYANNKDLPQPDSLYLQLINNINCGIVLFKNKNKEIIFINNLAKSLLGSEMPFNISDIGIDFDYNTFINQNKPIIRNVNGVSLKIKFIPTEVYSWLIVMDYSEMAKIESINDKYLKLNKEFMAVFAEYGDETILITDNKGIIEFAGEEIGVTCGVPKDFFIGKNVYDMEAQKIFYPSVCVKVLETKEKQVVIQRTRINQELVSVGVPLFDDFGNLEKIVSITRNYKSQIKISTMIAELEKIKHLNNISSNGVDDIVTCDERMLEIKSIINLIAQTNSTVLINGETGTGKEIMARAIHKKSDRKNKPFIKINCGSISPSIVESELYGYEPGAFTGARKDGKTGLIEAANTGTLFLDEVSELPMEQQVKLLHVIQEKFITRVGGTCPISLDIRIIAASNKDLEELIHQGLFREDLYYRLNVIPIMIPPLRERPCDISLLTKYFLTFFCNHYNVQKQLSKSARELISNYLWPGNIRELENTIERLVLTTEDCLIDTDNMPQKIRNYSNSYKQKVFINEIVPLHLALEETEKKLILMALKKYKTTAKIATVLGVNQSTISRKIAHYKLNRG